MRVRNFRSGDGDLTAFGLERGILRFCCAVCKSHKIRGVEAAILVSECVIHEEVPLCVWVLPGFAAGGGLKHEVSAPF